jgi:hypothetical protein
MKKNIDVLNFLKTGDFGDAKIKDSKETVIRKLGNPDGHIKLTNPLIGIHYGNYEFVFDGEGLRSIQNDNFNSEYPDSMEFSNEMFLVESGFLKSDKTIKLGEIKLELEKVNISYKIVDYWERKVLKTESGVIIDFNDEEWDKSSESMVKILDMNEYEFIGIRYYPFG